MKKFLSFIVLVFGMVNIYAQADFGGGGKCSCTSLGCSASKKCSTAGQSCNCSCSLTICTCTDCSATHRPPTVSAEQHANREQLSLILRSLNTSTATLSANLLDESYQALLRGDVEVYLSKGREGEENLKNLSLSEKNALNNWIQSKGSDIRI